MYHIIQYTCDTVEIELNYYTVKSQDVRAICGRVLLILIVRSERDPPI